jgi:thioesterase domain-containing protein
LRAGGTGSPLFLFHPAGGESSIYDELAAQLPAGLPVYAIQSRTFAGLGDEWASIGEMARNYAQMIARVQPDGALRLAGYSAGGVFALTTASELERQGRSVALVGLIETPVSVLDPSCPRELVLRNLIVEIYDHLTSESELFRHSETGDGPDSMMELAKLLVAETDEAVRLSIALNWLAKHGVSIDRGADSRQKRYLEIFIRHAALLDRVNFEPVNAPVWLWRADASWLSNLPTPLDIRGRIARGGFREEILEGRHFEVMHLPKVRKLAALLTNALQMSKDGRTKELSVAR